MQKGYKRNRKGIAVLNFFIGLIVLGIVVCLIYFFIDMVDYSDKLEDPEVSMRPYVEVTPTPEAVNAEKEARLASIYDNDEGDSATISETNVGEATVVPTAEPTAVPTSVPTPTPEPTPIVTPSPEPTSIPTTELSQAKIGGFTVPAPSDSATVAITDFHVSKPDSDRIIVINGYGYVDEEAFDGSTAQIYLIVTQAASGKQIAYKCSMIEGISGEAHEGVVCKNAEKTDFQTCIDVSQYPDGEYDLGIILQYIRSGVTAYSYRVMEESFTVNGGAAVSDLPID